MDRETGPAATDFQHVVRGLELELPTKRIIFSALSIFERLAGPVESGTGVGHARIEPQAIELVAEVVVLRDVAATGVHGVLSPKVTKPIDDFQQVHTRKVARRCVGPLQCIHVVDEPGNDCSDIIRVP